MVLSLLYTLMFALCGVYISEVLLAHKRPTIRLFFGLVLGLFMMTWLPSLFAFIFGFNTLSVLLGLGVALVLGAYCSLKAKGRIAGLKKAINRLIPLAALLPMFAVGLYLFLTHIIMPEDGALFVGQTTYGDLAMHLGFISSIAEQGVFPPEYSIFPGHTINYPFLNEVSSSALCVLGCPLRTAYLIPAIYAYVLVLVGVYIFFEQWLKRKGRAVFATLLFFVGGGFGFAYFFDLINNGSSALSTLLGSGTANNLVNLLDGFYETPTNLPRIGLRWVNPIVDMLVPQRATLFGWAFLFPCLYLLHGWMFSNERKNLPILILLAGGLPLIHTHSFLALGVISGVYCLYDLILHFNKRRLTGWLIYGGAAILLALPQLVIFTFSQASESSMVQVHFNWANEIDSYLWFYVKNLGWLFILLPFSLLLLSKRDRQIMLAPLVLWFIAECVIFQPNIYDNNKLLFVWFAYLCGLTAKLLGVLYNKAKLWTERRSSPEARARADRIVSALLFGAVFIYLFIKLISAKGTIDMEFGSACTLIVLLGLCTYLQGVRLKALGRGGESFPTIVHSLSLIASSGLIISLLVVMYRQYSSSYISFTSKGAFFLLVALALLCTAAQLLFKPEKLPRFERWGAHTALRLCAYLMSITLFLSGAMTIVREMRSKYQAFSAAQVQASEFILENTDPDATFLTDANWHLNTVAVLTGRDIVCGTNTFLYYHGVDTTERRGEVTSMFENPIGSTELFEKYSVDYVYIGDFERANYSLDNEYFAGSCELIYDAGNIQIYKLP